MKISSIKAKEILTSKGTPTVEVILETSKGQFIASVPSGVSTGDYEAVEIPASEAVKKIATIEPLLASQDFSSQKEFDCFLIKQDGTKNKSFLGGNTMLALSIAFARAMANENNQQLFNYLAEGAEEGGNLLPTGRRFPPSSCFKMPRPAVLLFEGGKHGQGGLTFQEILLVPSGNSFQEMLDKAKNVFAGLQSQLNYPLGVEGGMVAPLKEEEILSLINQHTTEQIGIDAAASSFFSQGKYNLAGQEITVGNLLAFYQTLQKKYNILFVEDPFAQDDYSSWQKLPRGLTPGRSPLMVVGDDLTATNCERIEMAKEQNLCNAVIIKPNQIGTVWETLQAIALAKKFGWKIIVSHRAGETEDSFIADLAVGAGADFIKTGGLTQSVRMAKYNRMLEIEKEMNLTKSSSELGT
ncbi:MAG: phosphopyruvate hydratase [Candidatus Gribaldobacteria bacterium]|nr:phosphopyruvate hydratase [Candidatus Gribaldobacteria bacterium]